MCRLMAVSRWAHFVRVVLLLSVASPLLAGFCLSILEHLISYPQGYPCGESEQPGPGDCPPATCDPNDGTLNWQGNKDYSIVYAWKLDLCNDGSIIVSQMAYLTMAASFAMTGVGMVFYSINRKQALTLGLALSALFALLSTLVAEYSSFVLLEALFGLAFGSVCILPLFYMVDLAGKEDDGRVTGRMWLAAVVSAIFFFCLGLLKLGDLCASLATDWKELYLTVTVAALICCALLQAFLPEAHEMAATLKDAAQDEYLLLP